MGELAATKFQENGQRDQKILLLNEVWTKNQVSLNQRKSTLQKPRKIWDQTNYVTKSEMTMNRVTIRQYSTVLAWLFSRLLIYLLAYEQANGQMSEQMGK